MNLESESYHIIPIQFINYRLCFRHILETSDDAEFETFTQIAVELLALEFLVLFEKQAATQLQGGRYFQPSEKVKQSAKNVPKTNVLGERDMAVLDNLLRMKPGKELV